MRNTFISIISSVLIVFAVLILAYFYMPFFQIEAIGQTPDDFFGTTITTINGSDTLSASRTTINNNFSALNSGKIENSTSSLPHLTTLANLTTVGTIGTGVWRGTAIEVGYAGTGTTSPSLNQIILGNGSSGFKTVSGFGTTGQYLISNGAGQAPSWQTAAIDQSADYNWTGSNTFSGTLTVSAASTFSSTSTFSGPVVFTGRAQMCAGGMGYQTPGTTGNQVISHSLGATPTFVSIHVWAAKGTENAQSFGIATTTPFTGAINQNSTWSYLDTGGSVQSGAGQSTTTIVHLTSPYSYEDKVSASITALTSTNFTLNWATNGTDYNARFYEWSVCR